VAAETSAAESVSSIRLSAWQSLVSLVRGWNPALQFAAGLAALICVAGASWITIENAAMRSRVAALEAQRRDLEIREQVLRRQLGEEQGRAGSLAAQLNQQQSRAGAPPPMIASLVLLPGVSRATRRVDQLVLNPSAQLAHIEIQLEARDVFPRFNAELRTRRGEEALIRSNLARRRGGTGFVVSFDVPASALSAGEYELTLKGVPSDRPAEDIGYYYFSVQKR
jgi:hypothetical protein